MTNNKLHNELKAFLEREYGKWQYDEKNGCYFDEPYVDYNDELADKDITNILEQEEPEWALEDMLSDCYQDTEWQYRDDIIDKFQKTEEGSKYDWDEINDELVDMWYLKIPFEHYRQQEVCMDVLVDTGDSYTGSFYSKNLIDVLVSKSLLEFCTHLIQKFNVHLMIQETVNLENIALFYNTVFYNSFFQKIHLSTSSSVISPKCVTAPCNPKNIS